FRAVVGPGTGSERLQKVAELLILRKLVAGGGGDVENLAAKRQDGLRGPVARLLGRPAGRISLDDKQFRSLRGGVGAVRELAGKSQLADRRLARDVLLEAPPDALLSALNRPIQQLCGLARRGREPMIKGVSHGAVDQTGGFRRLQPALVLSLELRFADEDGYERRAADHDVVGRERACTFGLADPLGVIFQAAQERRAQSRLVCAAVGRRNRV